MLFRCGICCSQTSAVVRSSAASRSAAAQLNWTSAWMLVKSAITSPPQATGAPRTFLAVTSRDGRPRPSDRNRGSRYCGARARHPREGRKQMAARVLSTDQAKSAIQQVQAIINGGLTDQIARLDSQGKILSDPDVWDGPLAQQFRDQTWPETKSALERAKQELDQLRQQLQTISQNIMSAGGG